MADTRETSPEWAALIQSIRDADARRFQDSIEIFLKEDPLLETFFGGLMRSLWIHGLSKNDFDGYMNAEFCFEELFDKVSTVRLAILVGHISTDLRIRAIRQVMANHSVEDLAKTIRHLYGNNPIFNDLIFPTEIELSILEEIGQAAYPAVATLIYAMNKFDRVDHNENYRTYQFACMRILRGLGPLALDAVPSLMKTIDRGVTYLKYDHGLPAEAIRTLMAIGPAAVTAIPLLHEVIARPGHYGPTSQMELLALEAVKKITSATENAAESTWDVEAGKFEKQLKVFYLIGRMYDEGKDSFRSAAAALMQLESKIFEDDLPASHRHYRTVIEQLEKLFETIFNHKDISFLVTRKGFGNTFSDDGQKALKWTGDFLKRNLPPDWFGFSQLSTPSEIKRKPPGRKRKPKDNIDN